MNADEILRTGVASLPVDINDKIIEIKGPVVFKRNFLEEKSPSDRDTQNQNAPQIDFKRFPYFLYMLMAIKEAPFESEGRTPKKIIEVWLRDNWPENLGKATDTKVSTMATFLRRPEDEGGGNHGKATDN